MMFLGTSGWSYNDWIGNFYSPPFFDIAHGIPIFLHHLRLLSHQTDSLMPTPVKPFPEDSIERRAYAAADAVPVVEDNDHARLGYHVWLYLTREIATLTEAVHVAQARTSLSEKEQFTIIADALRAQGFTIGA